MADPENLPFGPRLRPAVEFYNGTIRPTGCCIGGRQELACDKTGCVGQRPHGPNREAAWQLPLDPVYQIFSEWTRESPDPLLS